MLRIVLGVLAGAVVGVIVVLCVETAGHLLFPAPAGLDLSTPEAIRENIGKVPVAAIASVAVAWTLGALAGALLAARISRRAWAGYAIGALIFVLALFNLIAIPHPLWMWAAGLGGIAAGGWYGGKLGANSRKAN